MECDVCSGGCEVLCGFLVVSDLFQPSCRLCSLNLRRFRKHGEEVACTRFAIQSSAGKCLVQALQYKVVLGVAWCKLCSIK